MSWKVADVHEESALNDIFTKGVDFTICHSLREYWATYQHIDVTNIVFKTQSMLAIQKGSVNQHCPVFTSQSRIPLLKAIEISRQHTFSNQILSSSPTCNTVRKSSYRRSKSPSGDSCEHHSVYIHQDEHAFLIFYSSVVS